MSTKKNILFVSHDANRAGAQLLLLDAMLYLKSKGYGVLLLLLQDWGNVFDDYKSEFDIKVLPQKTKTNKLETIIRKIIPKDELKRFIRKNYSNSRIDLIYANTIASAAYAPAIKKVLEVPLLTHIHELQYSIGMYASIKDANKLLNASHTVIACSKAVGDNLVTSFPEIKERVKIVHSFVDNQKLLEIHSNSNPMEIKEEFNLPQSKMLIGGCGNAEWRKGVDIFLQIVKKSKDLGLNEKLHFVWIGMQQSGDYANQVDYDVKKMGIADEITFIKPTPKAKEIINSLDIFLVSSREDPFPLVMLEAALCQKPIVGFENTGGCSEFVKDECGKLAPYMDIEKLVDILQEFNKDSSEIKYLGTKAQEKVIDNYGYLKSMEKIETILQDIK